MHWRWTIWVMILTGYITAFSQQPMQYSQFMQNKYLINPAYGGMEGSLSIFAGFRSQWTNLDGAPKSQNISAHLPLYHLQGSAGFAFQNENAGGFNMINWSGSYNYIVETTLGVISFGAKLGVSEVKVDGNDIRTPTGTYEGNVFDHNDPILQVENMQGLGALYGLGAYFLNDNVQVGLSLDNFPSFTMGVKEINFVRKSVVSLYGEYTIFYNNILSLTPGLLIKSDLTQTQIDLFGKVSYNNLFGGLGLRGYSSSSFDALVLLMGVQFNEHYRLSYSYDYGISGLRHFHDGSHEFTLNYNLQKLIGSLGQPKIIFNPRY